METNRCGWLALGALVAGLLLGGLATYQFDRVEKTTPPAQAEEVTASPADTPAPVAQATSSYQIIVGAEPSFNVNQTFSPPPGAEVITNGEAQLEALKKETRSAAGKTQ